MLRLADGPPATGARRDRGAGDVPRRRAARRRRRRLARAAPGPAGRGPAAPDRGPARRPARPRRRRRADRRAGGAGRRPPAARRAVAAADHRAVPGRPAGRRAGRVPPGPAPAGRRAGLDPGAELRALEQRVLRQDRGLRSPGAGDRPGNLAGPVGVAGRPGRRPGGGRRAARRPAAGHRGRPGRGRQDPAGDRGGRGRRAGGGAWLVRLDGGRRRVALAERRRGVRRERGHRGDGPRPAARPRAAAGARQLRAPRRRRCPTWSSRDAERGARAAGPGHQPGAAGHGRRDRVPAGAADDRGLGRAVPRAGRAARRSFALDEDTEPDVEAVCRSLDGLPLAIELAAARVKALSVQEIARRLDDRFTLLNDPTSHRPPRQRTLRAAIAWSYDLLFPDDQRGLWALACFSGGAPLAAVEYVLGRARRAGRLGRRRRRPAGRPVAGRRRRRAGGAVRYRLLDSVREFSLRPAARGGTGRRRARARTRRGSAAAADRAAAGRPRPGAGRAPGHRPHRAGQHRRRAGLGRRPRPAAGPADRQRVRLGLGRSSAPAATRRERIRAALAAAGTRGRGRRSASTGLLLAGWLEASGGDLDRATADIEHGDGARRRRAARRGRGCTSPFVRSQQGRAQDALALLADCRTAFHRARPGWEEGASWVLAAWAEIALGETARGRAACDEALRLLEPARRRVGAQPRRGACWAGWPRPSTGSPTPPPT